MRLAEVASVLDGIFVSAGVDLGTSVEMACGADLMSDVLAFTHVGTLLLTGLVNPQVVRTAEMAEVKAIVFVRGKIPPSETISLAEAKAIPLMATQHTMYEACGRLYVAGLRGCGLFELSTREWEEKADRSPDHES